MTPEAPVHSKAVFVAACAVMAHHPEALTDEEIHVLGECNARSGLEAKHARTRAQERIAAEQAEHEASQQRRTATAPAPSGITMKTLNVLVDVLIEEVIKPLHRRVTALEAAIGAPRTQKSAAPTAELDLTQPGRVMMYVGVWADTSAYAPGATVTHGGSLWLAEERSQGVRPGTDPRYWKLIVKKGAFT